MSASARRVALVIGNAAYQGSPLRNPVNDARDMAASLSRIGFTAIDSADGGLSALLDLDYDRLRGALADFAQASHGAAQAVLYYAGHGLEYQGENYLIPVGARLEHATRLEFEAASLGQILRNIDDDGGLRLIILDACRNNHFRSQLFGARDIFRGLRAVEPQGGILVAYAAKHGTVALDGEGRNSPFATSLLQHIEKPGLEVVQLFREVRSDVLNTTGRHQEPHLYGSLGRDQEYLVPPETPEPAVPILNVDAATREHTFWTAISSSPDLLLFEDFLNKFPDGTYSLLASTAAEARINECVSAEALKRLIALHPESARVELARARIAKLKEARKPANANWLALGGVGLALLGAVWGWPLSPEPPKPPEPVKALESPRAAPGPRQTADATQDAIAKIAATSDRDAMLALAKGSPEARMKAEQRLGELGYLKVVTGRGDERHESWLREGRANPESPDSFRDCEKCPEMIVVPPGKFLMGSTPKTDPNRFSDEDDGAGRQVEIAIPQSFAVGRFEVTFDEWEACAESGGCSSNKTPDDRGFGKGPRPVINVSWRDAQEYVAWINKKAPDNRSYRLLSEAEWEYAARGVTTATQQPPYFFGADEKQLCGYGNVADESAKKTHPDWTVAACDDGQATTSPVGEYKPNAFGLKDTIGNVWEWVEDCYHASYKDIPSDVRTAGKPWLDSCRDFSLWVLRGGSWTDNPRYLRSALRLTHAPTYRYFDVGFRISRTLYP
jgi:formylglycine-generating enzyme required for sulfatase activity